MPFPVRPTIVLLLLTSLLLGGCGFRLRGELLLPQDLGPLAVVSADPNSPLAHGLRRDLARAGVELAAADAAAAQLRILVEQWESRPLSVDAFVAVREYRLRHIVQFELVDAAGERRIAPQTIELDRETIYEPAEAFGNPGEQEILQDELRRDMRAAILRRVDVALRSD